ncbi:unnamed protein product [Rotaria socialis]|uniref:Uncharacterized protein n=1 Tax=Rotaria socialis TaxID=392032 RepID=A0A817SDV6_9BILA|nr:unnamed protein product [Rotaria socialis]CAF3434829.1 unnamed protein product [Rotaria socialis]CAF3705031.1 unnamed protein product [Rotaria socialis]CAF4451554.1 unnamed protein product [Rotaria socialis]CAF4510385.1 unnamed protein product [Rotaria socialis]
MSFETELLSNHLFDAADEHPDDHQFAPWHEIDEDQVKYTWRTALKSLFQTGIFGSHYSSNANQEQMKDFLYQLPFNQGIYNIDPDQYAALQIFYSSFSEKARNGETGGGILDEFQSIFNNLKKTLRLRRSQPRSMNSANLFGSTSNRTGNYECNNNDTTQTMTINTNRQPTLILTLIERKDAVLETINNQIERLREQDKNPFEKRERLFRESLNGFRDSLTEGVNEFERNILKMCPSPDDPQCKEKMQTYEKILQTATSMLVQMRAMFQDIFNQYQELIEKLLKPATCETALLTNRFRSDTQQKMNMFLCMLKNTVLQNISPS